MATKKIGEIERHQYILNENAPAAMISLEKRIVKNDEWYEENAGKEVRKLEKYVRTKSNPEGWLDKRLYVPQNNKVVEETVKF
ncbi:MAG: hypothetical protein MI867_12165, partial [Pseudomonadales bacterium]|nr:hypothetical protein [Pseudomonadales bacterium]